MGMFDTLHCFYMLPIDNSQNIEFQTKDTPAQFCDEYEIRADGTLWYEEYEVEDQSDPTKEGLGRLVGMMAKVNKRWERTHFTGDLEFYGFPTADSKDLVVFHSHFVDGQLTEIRQVESR